MILHKQVFDIRQYKQILKIGIYPATFVKDLELIERIEKIRGGKRWKNCLKSRKLRK